MVKMKRRSLETRFWKDSYIQSLPAKGKLLFNYLLMNEYVNIIHIYELPENYISLETGLTSKEIQEFKTKFQNDGKFLFKDNWIKICNADKYEHYEGETNEKAKKNFFKIIPSHIIQYFNTAIHTPPIPPRGYLITNNQQPITNNINNNNINNAKKYSKREDVTDRDFEEISNKYLVPITFVKSKWDDVCNWEDEKPGRMRGRNWKLTLMNWVKRDALKIKQDYAKQNRYRGIDASNVK